MKQFVEKAMARFTLNQVSMNIWIFGHIYSSEALYKNAVRASSARKRSLTGKAKWTALKVYKLQAIDVFSVNVLLNITF